MSEYNGWSNYETWNVALWMDNDPGTYEIRLAWVTDALEEVDGTMVVSYLTGEQRAVRIVADLLQEYIEGNNPLAEEASVYSDILSANLHEVNWREIAMGWVEEAQEVEV